MVAACRWGNKRGGGFSVLATGRVLVCVLASGMVLVLVAIDSAGLAVDRKSVV